MRATPDGERVLEEATDAVARADDAFLTRLTPTERIRLRQLLRAVGPQERPGLLDLLG